ncbi:MAG TPA: uroporphyrinogen decarboxylase family protein [Ruminiclostridium sp.]
MTKRENLLSLLRRQGIIEAPIDFTLCPSLYETFMKNTGAKDYADFFQFPMRGVEDLYLKEIPGHNLKKFYKYDFKPGTTLDIWGVAHEPGSAAAKHMTKMHHPLISVDSLEELKEFPFPDFSQGDGSHQKIKVEEIHGKGLAAIGNMECTIWETSWYMRSMEELMIDMMMEDEKAEYILDRVTESSCIRAASFAKAGVDIIRLGDDIGMQSRIMMREEMYRTWLKPRLKKVIDAAKAVNPDIIIMYHSCGYVKPLINDLVEAGIDVLNPVQPECMNFEEIHQEFGDRLSFHGTIGTQTTMPFGSVEEVKREVYKNLTIAGDKGGLLCAPTHMLEPEVPWENIIAYMEACKEFIS